MKTEYLQRYSEQGSPHEASFRFRTGKKKKKNANYIMKPLNKGSIKRRPKCPVFHVLSLTRNFRFHRALYIGNAHFFVLALAPYTNLSYCQNINIVLDCIMHVIFLQHLLLMQEDSVHHKLFNIFTATRRTRKGLCFTT